MLKPARYGKISSIFFFFFFVCLPQGNRQKIDEHLSILKVMEMSLSRNKKEIYYPSAGWKGIMKYQWLGLHLIKSSFVCVIDVSNKFAVKVRPLWVINRSLPHSVSSQEKMSISLKAHIPAFYISNRNFSFHSLSAINYQMYNFLFHLGRYIEKVSIWKAFPENDFLKT